ncbi:MAG: pentapeptide repeat-containing protein [Candidatus Competibacteraceae bacterium]
MEGARLQGADLRGAGLQGANLEGARLYRNGNPAESNFLDIRGANVELLSQEKIIGIPVNALNPSPSTRCS